MRNIKIFPLIFLLSSALILFTSCQGAKTSSTARANTDKKLFKLNIYSDKQQYKTTEKINIWSTLEYIGEEDKITIWHGEPALVYSITDGKDFKLEGVVLDVLKSTEIEKDRVYRFDYVKSGGYTQEDPMADFWKKFFSERDLYLPAGEYTIKVSTNFSLDQSVVDSFYKDSVELKIRVVE